ncbi:aldolase (plasmid) [Pseudohalocynthiibacter aestuariivivens]|uniref:Aldolase/citrate lyase family protein n=1 Tax=Roseovarius pelagicus TaxID=2980108 RepID=A0ABY6DC32_9RHOB|nr:MULTISPECIES: aldolase/citrate lyase family protein [Rhodobacterales]QIE47916.1 aldolase [Pseudohalocynthiibacter aestuariivivens]UXX81410.1 aldolase/citrate lyase family protein [Roseovarius pelagicus]
MLFYMIADDPAIAQFASANGVDRIFVDLEYMGKDERQKGLDTWKSRQGPDDVTKLREAVPGGHILVRVNPLHDGSAREIDDVVARGADSVMLPMFRGADDLARFMDMLNGRAEALPLVETKAALDALPEIATRIPLNRLHIGLNDLHLDMGLKFMFQIIADGTLEDGCAALRAAGIAFGIGGLARAHEGIVNPAVLLGEHVRLGSTAAILSRTFHRGAESLAALREEMDFAAEVATLRGIYREFQAMSPDALEQNRRLAADRINDVVHLLSKR